jgi:hypothetical protein
MNVQLTPGEPLTLAIGSPNRAGAALNYTGTFRGFNSNGQITFYLPQLASQVAAGTAGINLTPLLWVFGATSPVVPVSTQNQTIGTGTKVLTLPTTQVFAPGENVTFTDRSATANSMTGTIVSYSPTTGALILNVTSDTGDGNAVSGNWTLGLSIPQTIVNSFLANDYFTPTATNTAHQTFYGFANGNATAATPGTLMGFIQNPFSGNDTAALSGLAGGKIQIGQTGAPVSLSAASALHVSPEINLVNPSTSINGGDISVLTNWNLGAGIAGPDGNPASLYFRYIGWAPTITLRAANNVNLGASITDGFFQKAEMVNGFTPPTGDTYLTAIGSNRPSTPIFTISIFTRCNRNSSET